MTNIIKGELYLVTGGSGFLGGSLIKSILDKGGRVRALSRNEGKLITLQQEFKDIEILTGDICNKVDIIQALKGVRGVFHLAAFKHVGMAEELPHECTRTNVIGSINILNETIGMDIDFIIGISTDKAAQVSGVYGATKLLMERLFCQFEKINPSITYRIVRYGNVLYSTGSVLCKWKHLIENGEEVVVTEPNATRFFWTREQAVALIFECLDNAKDSAPFVPEMKSMAIRDLLTAMANKYMPKGQELKVNEIGLQPGENLHEKILEDGKSSDEVERFTIEEIMRMI
jgi:UDP-N-acetylglucosamine 4,6-dehydratase